MDCTSGYESFGCMMDSMGGSVAEFLNTFGNPFVLLLFLGLSALAIVVMGRAFTNIVS